MSNTTDDKIRPQPVTHGLQSGFVCEIAGDPDGEFRVLIVIPAIDPEAKVWAKLANLYSTVEGGVFFYPEIGDDVLVGFLNNNHASPVILGSLYSKRTPPPVTPTQDNAVKAFVTKSELKIMFDDNNKIITITTPANNSVVLNDNTKSVTLTDENNNMVQLSPDSIKLDSQSNITINARGDISISGANVNMNAENTASLKAMNLTLNAEVTATLSGSASLALTSSGELSVKGSMVEIN